MKFHLVYVGFLDVVISTRHQYHLLLGIRRCHRHIPGAHWSPIQVLAARIPQPDSNLPCQQLPPLWLFTSHISSRVSRVQNHRPGNNSQRGEVSTWAVSGVFRASGRAKYQPGQKVSGGSRRAPCDTPPWVVTWVPCPTVGIENEVKGACIWAMRDLVWISPLLFSSGVSLGRPAQSLILSILICEMGRFEHPYLKGCCMRS